MVFIINHAYYAQEEVNSDKDNQVRAKKIKKNKKTTYINTHRDNCGY